MKVTNLDLTKLDQVINILEGIVQHRQKNPTFKTEELYYKYLKDYYQRIKRAIDEEKPIVGHTVMIPVEILYAMDIVPMHLEATGNILTMLLNRYEEHFSTAAAMGLTPEVCSAHRLLAATVAQGILPRPDAIIWSNQVCDNTAKSGDAVMELYDCPGFFIDRLYRYTDEEVEYVAHELEDLVHFLEEVTGHKMDWDRLGEIIDHSNQMLQLIREIKELRKAVPAPMRNRGHLQHFMVEWFFAGTPEGTDFFRKARDELKAAVEAKRGPASPERYRLLTLFLPPFHVMKFLDALERDYGAMSVIEVYIYAWGEWEMDKRDPLKTIAKKLFYRSLTRQMHGPMTEGIVSDAVKAAVDYKVDGAIYWAHIGCRQACATIRSAKDALKEKLDIPTLVIDCDVIDPSFSPMEEIQDKLERFFEVLDDRK